MSTNAWAPDALAIDRESVVPIYRQLYERLREQILTGALPEGTRLPPERALGRPAGRQPQHDRPRVPRAGRRRADRTAGRLGLARRCAP